MPPSSFYRTRRIPVTIRKTFIILVLLTVLGLAGSLVAAPRLPERVPSHWNAAGEVNGYSSRNTALYLMPALMFGLGVMILYIPQIDPLRANVEKFRTTYNWVVVGFAVYMLYIHALTLLAGVGVKFNMTAVMLPAMGGLFFGLGFLLDRARRNWFIGIRTPWTLSSDHVWEKTHRLGGLLFKIAGLLVVVGAFLPGETSFWVMFGLIMTASFAPVVYSYVVFRREQEKGG